MEKKDLEKEALEKCLEKGLEEADEIVRLFIEKYGDPGEQFEDEQKGGI